MKGFKQKALFGATLATLALSTLDCTGIRPAVGVDATRNYSRFDRAEQTLGVPSFMVSYLPEGYFTTNTGHNTLRIPAGIYAGTIDVIKEVNNGTISYSANGSYSEMFQPEAMVRAMKEADVNGDEIVTDKEAQDLANKVIKEYAK
ncbi:MAG: hypothetical protein H6502_05555 [Candidatus Woesearchaeota archaeon]|nr:MAG: hypothetical protein H6502_05555 [Candidatus Woesearchaeota archaeon]